MPRTKIIDNGNWKTLLLMTFLLQVHLARCSKKKILSFGGNGNIGSEVMDRLVKSDQDYDITIVTRGSWHFDSAIRVQPFVRMIECDRAFEPTCDTENTQCEINSLRYCPDLIQLIEDTDQFYAVLDFSAYESKWVHDASQVLKGKTRVYVYISTDSVYEVCSPSPSDRNSIESDAQRPSDPEMRKELRQNDVYGDSKLAGEEALIDQAGDEGGFPWVALRFADVIGPRDTTERWFLYQLWVKFYHALDIPIFVPPTVVDLKQSLTYVNDAANAVISVMNKDKEVWNNAYNIAMEEEVTLWDTVRKMAKFLNVSDIEQDNSHSDRAFHMYPSVYNGPVDISKAKQTWGFKPTPIDEAIEATVKWYEEAFVNLDSHREDLISRLITYVVPRTKEDDLYLAVDTELEKKGVVKERHRKRKRGETGEFKHHEEL